MLTLRLDQGVRLECSDVLIPWGMPLHDVEHVAGCLVVRYNRSHSYEWRNRVCFGGLPCTVRTSRFHDEFNPRAYHLYLDHFHSAGVEILQPRVQPNSVEADFRSLLAHLESYLGSVVWSYPRYSRGLPAVFWEFPSLRISFAILGEAFFHISVQDEPIGYPDLRSAAEAISKQNGPGARREGIAW